MKEDKENDYSARPITARSRSPYQVQYVAPNIYKPYQAPPPQEPIQITYYNDYQSTAGKNKDPRYQTPSVMNVKSQQHTSKQLFKQERSQERVYREQLVNVNAKGQTSTFLNTPAPKVTIRRDEVQPASQQLKKIIGVKKSPQDSQTSFNLSYNRQSIISNVSGGTMKQSAFELNSKNCSPIALKPNLTHSHNKSYTHDIQTKISGIQQRCKSPTACELNFSRKPSKEAAYSQFLMPHNNSNDYSDDVDLTYTHTHTNRSNQQTISGVPRKAAGSPPQSQPIVIGKLLFNEHFQTSKPDSKRNLSFNQLLDSQKQKAELSARKSSQMSLSKKKVDLEPPRRVSIAPFESGRKDENEIQLMVETLKQNILRDLQEVSKRCIGGSSYCSSIPKVTSTFQMEHSNDSALNRFSFNQHEMSGKLATNQSQISGRESLSSLQVPEQPVSKPPIRKVASPDQIKASFQKEGVQLFQQLSSVLNNGKEFYHQINSHRSKKEEYNSPEEPKQKPTHKSNTPSFHHQQQLSIGSINAIRPLPSPLQLSFNITDILSDQKNREHSNTKEQSPINVQIEENEEPQSLTKNPPINIDLIESPVLIKQKREEETSQQSSQKSMIINTNESNLNEAEPEEEQICSQSTPRYSDVAKEQQQQDPNSQITINNLSSITPDLCQLPNKKLNVSLDSLLDGPSKKEQEGVDIELMQHSCFKQPTNQDAIYETVEAFHNQQQDEELEIQTPNLHYEQQQPTDTSQLQIEPSNDSLNITVENSSRAIPQGSASRQERYQQLLRNFKEYRCQSNHQSQVKFDLPQIITPKAQSICEQPSNIGHISDFIIHSQGQRDSMAVTQPVQMTESIPVAEQPQMLESVALSSQNQSEASQKLITFSHNESDNETVSMLKIDRPNRAAFKRRSDRNNCPSFRDVLREHDRSATRIDTSVLQEQPPSICRKINFNNYNTQQEVHSHSVIDDLLSQRQQTENEAKGLSFLEYMKRKHM